MGDYTKGEFGTYEVTPELASLHPHLTEGEELVFLPLGVDDDGAAAGLAFTTSGIIPVTVPAEVPEDHTVPAQAPAGVNAGDWQAFQKYRADQEAQATQAQAPAETGPAVTTQGPATGTTPEGTNLTLPGDPEPAPTTTTNTGSENVQ